MRTFSSRVKSRGSTLKSPASLVTATACLRKSWLLLRAPTPPYNSTESLTSNSPFSVPKVSVVRAWLQGCA
ncbi:hypothetical protein D3C73_1199860 [compost metagenome]